MLLPISCWQYFSSVNTCPSTTAHVSLGPCTDGRPCVHRIRGNGKTMWESPKRHWMTILHMGKTVHICAMTNTSIYTHKERQLCKFVRRNRQSPTNIPKATSSKARAKWYDLRIIQTTSAYPSTHRWSNIIVGHTQPQTLVNKGQTTLDDANTQAQNSCSHTLGDICQGALAQITLSKAIAYFLVENFDIKKYFLLKTIIFVMWVICATRNVYGRFSLFLYFFPY